MTEVLIRESVPAIVLNPDLGLLTGGSFSPAAGRGDRGRGRFPQVLLVHGAASADLGAQLTQQSSLCFLLGQGRSRRLTLLPDSHLPSSDSCWLWPHALLSPLVLPFASAWPSAAVIPTASQCRSLWCACGLSSRQFALSASLVPQARLAGLALLDLLRMFFFGPWFILWLLSSPVHPIYDKSHLWVYLC